MVRGFFIFFALWALGFSAIWTRKRWFNKANVWSVTKILTVSGLSALATIAVIGTIVVLF